MIYPGISTFLCTFFPVAVTQEQLLWMDSSCTWFHTNSIEEVPLRSKMAAPFRRSAAGWQQRGGSYKKRTPDYSSMTGWTKQPQNCCMNASPCSIFTLSFMINYSNLPQRERVKAAAIMRCHVKVITDGATSHLAYNNDNLCPPRPFQTSSVCACWWWTCGMWWKNLPLAPISIEAAQKKQQRRPPCAIEIAWYVFSEIGGYSSPLSGCHLRMALKRCLLTPAFSLVLMCYSCWSEMWNISFSCENRWLL